MSTAGLAMVLALCAYTTGVWGERLSGRLEGWHVAFFLAGLVADSWGTGIMVELAGKWTASLHGLTGVAALVLMAAHAMWAAVVLWRSHPEALERFHRISTFVWAAWLVPFLSGAYLAMRR